MPKAKAKKTPSSFHAIQGNTEEELIVQKELQQKVRTLEANLVTVCASA